MREEHPNVEIARRVWEAVASGDAERIAVPPGW